MLTPEALAARRLGIGGSDAAKIVSGDWHALWLDKTGRSEPKAILSPWDTAVRHALEPVILDFWPNPVTRRGETVVSKEYPFLRCTLDGIDEKDGIYVDAKALNIWTPDPIRWCIDKYTPQMNHTMIVTGLQKAALAVSLGMKKPDAIHLQRDEFWEIDYIEKCREFWRYVEEDRAPEQGAPMEIAPVAPALMRVVDMSESNSWAAQAATWLRFKGEAKAWETSVKEIKLLVEADVREARGHGIICTRSKAGALTIKESK